MASRFLEQSAVDPSLLAGKTEELLNKIPAVTGYDSSLHLSSGLARVLSRAEKEAREIRDDYISIEHLLLALLEEGEPETKEALRQFGLNREKLLNALRVVRGSQRVTGENPEDTYEARVMGGI